MLQGETLSQAQGFKGGVMKTLSIVGFFLVVVMILCGTIIESVMSAHASSTQALATLYSQSHPQTLAGVARKTDKNPAGNGFSSSKSAGAAEPVNADRLAQYLYLHQTRSENIQTYETRGAASLMSENQTPPL
jgi:ABC-type Na+ efflux pump permease subunit